MIHLNPSNTLALVVANSTSSSKELPKALTKWQAREASFSSKDSSPLIVSVSSFQRIVWLKAWRGIRKRCGEVNCEVPYINSWNVELICLKLLCWSSGQAETVLHWQLFEITTFLWQGVSNVLIVPQEDFISVHGLRAHEKQLGRNRNLTTKSWGTFLTIMLTQPLWSNFMLHRWVAE